MPYHVIPVLETPVKVTKYEKVVSQIPTLDEVRKTECMCNRCTHYVNCKIAAKLMKICMKHGTAVLITRCEDFDKLHEIGDAKD